MTSEAEPATSIPLSLSSVAPAVEARIDALLAAEAARWGQVDPELVPPIEALQHFVLDGGKRLRPAFCHWAYVGAGGAAGDAAVIDAGAALELLHAFALLHDDVMDGSSLRRGRPTVHVDFAGRHGPAGWRGEARRFGEGVAILVGDLAFVYADLLMVGVPPAATAIFNELRVELNIGQALDLIGTAEARRDLSMARRIATYKSGKYTIERPLHLGAALIGRLDELAQPLSAYGLPLGEAFQMRDDVLGTFGDPDVTGKPVGEDLREGKPTPLLAITTARAGARGSELLDRVGSPDLGDDEVAAIQALMIETGAREETERLVDELAGEAVAALDKVAITAEARAALTELAAFVGRCHRWGGSGDDINRRSSTFPPTIESGRRSCVGSQRR